MTERVYIDTNIFIHHFFREKKDFNPFSTYLKLIEKERKIGVISTLTLLEVVSAGRNVLTRETRLTQDEIDAEITIAIRMIMALKNCEFVPVDNQFDMQEILKDALSHLKTFKGQLKIDSKGKKFHDGLSTPDAIHLSIAMKTNCDKIASNDGDFNEIRGKLPINVEFVS